MPGLGRFEMWITEGFGSFRSFRPKGWCFPRDGSRLVGDTWELTEATVGPWKSWTADFENASGWFGNPRRTLPGKVRWLPKGQRFVGMPWMKAQRFTRIEPIKAILSNKMKWWPPELNQCDRVMNDQQCVHLKDFAKMSLVYLNVCTWIGLATVHEVSRHFLDQS